MKYYIGAVLILLIYNAWPGWTLSAQEDIDIPIVSRGRGPGADLPGPAQADAWAGISAGGPAGSAAGSGLKEAGTELSPFELLRRKAERGDPAAQHQLGQAYLKGDGVPNGADPVQAARCFAQAANRGLAEARHQLAELYLNGLGVSQSYERALELFKLAADQGYAESQNALDRLKIRALVDER